MKNKERVIFAAVFLAGICILSINSRAFSQKRKAEVSIKTVEENTNKSQTKPNKTGISADKNADAGDNVEGTDAFPGYQEPAASTLPNPFYALLRSLGSLIFILALIYLSIYGLKVYMNKKPGFSFSSNIHVLESVFLSANKSLHLVEVGGEVLLLGVTEGGMNVLKEISDPASLKTLLTKMTTLRSAGTTTPSPAAKASSTTAPSFKDVFQKAASGFKEGGAPSAAAETPSQEPFPKHEENIRNSLNILRRELEKIQEIRKKEIS